MKTGTSVMASGATLSEQGRNVAKQGVDAAGAPHVLTHEFLRQVLDHSPIGVSVSRRSDGVIIFANKRLGELVKLSPREIEGRTARSMFADPAQRAEIVTQLKREGGVQNAEARFIRVDGSPFWALLTISSCWIDSDPVNFAWIFDISKRKENEDVLRQSEQQLMTILEESSIGVSVSRRDDGRIIYANSRFGKMIGMSSDKLVGTTARNLYVDDAQRLHVVHRLKREGGVRDAEVQFRRVDGSPFWALLTVNNTVVRGEEVNLAWIYDITERKVAEQALKENEQRLLELLEKSPVGVAISTVEGTIQFANQRLCDMLATPWYDMLKTDTISFFRDPEQREQVLAELQRGGHVHDMEVALNDGRGDTRWTLMSWVHSTIGDQAAVVSWLYDITERRKSQEALRRSEERLRFILETSPVGISIVERKTKRRLFVNPSFVRMFGYPSLEEAMTDDVLHSYIDPEDHRCLSAELDCYGFVNGAEVHRRRPNGDEWWSLVDWRPIEFNGQSAVIVWHYDITQRKLAEGELKRLAITDPLTGTFNHRHFIERSEAERERAQRYLHPLSVLMIDIDFFKRINDRYGHAAGDEALRRFTATCLHVLRKTDFLGRLGGEEFAVLLPETDIQGGMEAGERLRASLAEVEVPTSDGEGSFFFTVSIGVTVVEAEDSTIQNALARADKALYQAKAQGRNQVIQG